MRSTAIALENVSVSFAASAQHNVLRNISLKISPQEQVAIIGPSGAGKTTLLETLAMARQPSKGVYALNNQQPWQLSSAARHELRASIFLVPQIPPLPPRQRVVTTVLAGKLPRWSFWQALSSLIYPTQSPVAFTALSAFDMQDKLYARVDRLSGGERQRVSLARLFASDAHMMLVDEPLSALDPTLAASVLGAILREASVRSATLVCSLHQVELARLHFPRLVGVRDGSILFDLPQAAVTDELIEQLYANQDIAPKATARDARTPQSRLLPLQDGNVC